MIHFSCPQCGKALKVPEEKAGRSVLCPRCGELFFRKFDDRPWRGAWQHNPFARRCMHCGLPKWAAVDPGPSPGEARP